MLCKEYTFNHKGACLSENGFIVTLGRDLSTILIKSDTIITLTARPANLCKILSEGEV